MACKAKYYDKKTRTERAWHNSSMIKYTEMVEDPNENWGTLTVVFNTGATYKYKKVSLSDYVYTVAGGIDASNGKTFNKMIKEHGYEYEKIDPIPQEVIDRGFEEVIRKQEEKYSAYFISGPEYFTEEEFDACIAQRIINVVNEEDEPRFVLADTLKFGTRVLEYLIDVLNIDPECITLYRIEGEDACCNREGVRINDACKSDDEMDQEMTAWTTGDIAIVRDWETTITRQSKNILRRYVYYN